MSECDLSGFFDFTDEELDAEINELTDDINAFNDRIRRLYCLRNLLLEEKEKRSKL